MEDKFKILYGVYIDNDGLAKTKTYSSKYKESKIILATGCVIYSNNSKYYYVNGLLHKEDGPAIVPKSRFLKPLYFYKGKEILANSLSDFQRKIKLLVFL